MMMNSVRDHTRARKRRKRRRVAADAHAALYDGRRYLGVILPHAKAAFRAVDCDERPVGVFASRREAAAAIMRGVR